MKAFKKEHKNEMSHMLIVTSAISIIILTLMIALRVNPFGLFTRVIPFLDISELDTERVTDIYLTQLSLTFITISVMSILSDNSVVIYWENIVQNSLIEPEFSCFYSFTVYSFACMALGAIALLLGNELLMLVFFVGNCISLSALTFKMIGVYYNRNVKKRKLEKDFLSASKDRKDNILLNLRQNTLKAYSNKNYDVFFENLDFCTRFFEQIYDVDEILLYFEKTDDTTIEPLVNAFSELINMGKESSIPNYYHSFIAKISDNSRFLKRIVKSGNCYCIWKFQWEVANGILNEYNRQVPNEYRIAEVEAFPPAARRRLYFYQKDAERINLYASDRDVNERFEGGKRSLDYNSSCIDSLMIILIRFMEYANKKDNPYVDEGTKVFFEGSFVSKICDYLREMNKDNKLIERFFCVLKG